MSSWVMQQESIFPLVDWEFEADDATVICSHAILMATMALLFPDNQSDIS